MNSMSISEAEGYLDIFACLVEQCFVYNDFSPAFNFEGERLSLFCWQIRKYVAANNISHSQFQALRKTKLAIPGSIIKGTEPALLWKLLVEDPDNETLLNRFLECPVEFLLGLVKDTKNTLLLCRAVDKLIAQPTHFPNRARLLALAPRLVGSAKLLIGDWEAAIRDYSGKDKEQLFAYLCGKA
jgi:hypothetical protein